jgi:hypothetical protein
MLKKLFISAAAAAAVSVPLAGAAWADPPSDPGPSSPGTPSGNGIGQGGVPKKAGSYFDSVSAANPGLPNLNPNGSGPIAPGTVFSTVAKLPGNTPDALGGFVNTIYGAYGTPESGGPVVTTFGKTPPGLATKTFTPGCLSGRTATDPAINGGNSVCH